MKKITIAASVMLALIGQAHAEPGTEGDKWIGVFGEYYNIDDEKAGYPSFLNDAKGVGIEYGFRFKPQWAGRLEYSRLDINAAAGGQDSTGRRLGADLMYFLNDDIVYIFGGIKNNKLDKTVNVLGYGIGKQWALNDDWKIITEVATYNNLTEGYDDLGFKLGVSYHFGSAPAPVQPKDSDNDGVFDPQDLCPNTPAGTQVDSTGCSVDSDNDGVLNSLDLCPETPLGTKVDSNGCNEDLDGDGVINSIDKCPNTPAGTKVGAKGCSLVLDTDQDGVLDDADKCANTPLEDQVDPTGCSIFLDEEVVQDLKVFFANNSSVIRNPNDPQFQDFADFMKRFPATDTVIEGHSSAPGNDDYNMMLSEKRAKAVRELLINQYGIAAERITSKGFGETQLLDTSNTPEAHAVNRRITAKVSASKRVKVLKN